MSSSENTQGTPGNANALRFSQLFNRHSITHPHHTCSMRSQNRREECRRAQGLYGYALLFVSDLLSRLHT